MSKYTDMKVGELREELVNKGRFTESEAKKLKKEELVKELESLNDDNDSLDAVLDNAEVVEETPIDADTIDSLPPNYNSPDWSDYVMSHFSDDELTEGKPNIVGLRRVAGLLLGPIVSSNPTRIESFMDPNGGPGRAFCTYKIVFDPWMANSHEDLATGSGLEAREFGGSADSFVGNTDDEFAVFPVAVAETRAEARALKRALQITKVAAEELTSKDPSEVVAIGQPQSEPEWDETGKIGDAQKTFIKNKCKALGIDMNKFINSGEESYKSIDEIRRNIAAKMIQRLNQYQNEADNLKIPEEIKA